MTRVVGLYDIYPVYRKAWKVDIFPIRTQRLDKVTAFHMACELGSMPIVEYMVSKDPAVCRITLVDYRGMTPLHLAASKNQVHVVEFLLEKVSSYFFNGRYIFGDGHRLLRNPIVELRKPRDLHIFLECKEEPYHV